MNAENTNITTQETTPEEETDATSSDNVVETPEHDDEPVQKRVRKPRRRRSAQHVAQATTPPAVEPTEVIELPQLAGAGAVEVTLKAASRTRRPVTEPATSCESIDDAAKVDDADSTADETETTTDGPISGVVGTHREAAQARVQQAMDEGLESVVGVIELPEEDSDQDVAAAADEDVEDTKLSDGSAAEDSAESSSKTRRPRRRRRTGSSAEDTAQATQPALDTDDSGVADTDDESQLAQPVWAPGPQDWSVGSIFSAAIPAATESVDEPVLAEAALAADPFIAPPTEKLPPLPAKTEDNVDIDDEADFGSADEDEDDDAGSKRRRRRRGGRGRRRRGEEEEESTSSASRASATADQDEPDEETADGDDEVGAKRRRRRRRRTSTTSESSSETRRSRGDRVTSVKGSTRLEAKRQRRREGRESGRRRPLISESQFLARRESVDRSLLVRQGNGRTQVAVLEDNVLVEHYVAQQSQTSMIGNVYLGRVQNVLPSMEAAFVDIGRGRNAVLYAGEVNWDAAGLDGQPRRIEAALKSGDSVLVQVTKDPIGHKGARLTSQVTMPGRYLVYVPGGSVTGISQKLPESERSRLKKILKGIVPDGAGVIVRTAAEGATEAELTADIARLENQWARIEKKRKTANPATALYTEPDLAIKMIRDVFNADFKELVISGDRAWETVEPYVTDLAPDLADRVRQWDGDDDIFDALRVNEQISKAVDRKVWLPSGGSLVIDRTEAMTVIDVNTGKFTGQGGNLEATVTENNLEAAEEIIRQLRLRDIGGIIVIDFIDMVLESNRDLVLRRMLECLSRDRTRHQVAEVTSLGLVQMTRKRIGQGLLEAFSECCTACDGRGVIVHDLVAPLDNKPEPRASKGDKQASKRRAVGAAAVARMAKAAKRTKADGSDEDTLTAEEVPSAELDSTSGEAESAGEAQDSPALSPMAALQSELAVQRDESTEPDDVVAESSEGGPADESAAQLGLKKPRPARRRRSRRSLVTKVGQDGAVVSQESNGVTGNDSIDTKGDTE